jgi:hypothetical protein
MSEDLTQNIPPRPFEERVLAELAAMRSEFRSELGRLEARISSLGEKVDRRLQETRPIWEDVQARVQRMETRFDLYFEEHNAMRLDVKVIGRRVDQIERQLAE